MVQIAKLDAASRQLNTAISLLLGGGDPIVVHTLAIAASNIFSDVLDNKSGGQSWREKLRTDHGLSKAKIRDVMHSAWNFFKHGDRDPDGVLEFDERECEHLIFFATLECGELQPTSIQMQTFQLWFLALGVLDLGSDNEIQQTAMTIFPGLGTLVRSEQLRVGYEMLYKQTEGCREEAQYMTNDIKKSLATAIQEISQETQMAKHDFAAAMNMIRELLDELHNYSEIHLDIHEKDYQATLSFPIPNAKVDSTIYYDTKNKTFHREDIVDLDVSDLLFDIAETTREEHQQHYAFSYSTATELAESYVRHLALAVNTINESRKSQS